MNSIEKLWNFFKFEKGELVTVNGVQNTAIISDANTNPSYYDDQYIRADIPIKTGDVVGYQYMIWFVISQPDLNLITYRAKMRQSNYMIKAVLDEVLYEFDSIIESVSASVENSKFIDTAAGKIVVTIPSSSLSNKVDINMRFVKLGYVWKVSGVDRSENGLNIIHADKEAQGANDDMVNEIANKDLIAVWSITVSDDNRNVNIDSDYTYTAIVMKNGQEDDGVVLVWSSSDESIATVLNGTVRGVALGNTIIAVYMQGNPNVNLELNIEVVEQAPDVITYKMFKADTDGSNKDYSDFSIIQGSTMLFGMEKYLNGVLIDNDSYTFALNPNGVPTSYYVYTVIGSTSVKIENDQMSPDSDLILTATSNQSSQTVSKAIMLKGLW